MNKLLNSTTKVVLKKLSNDVMKQFSNGGEDVENVSPSESSGSNSDFGLDVHFKIKRPKRNIKTWMCTCSCFVAIFCFLSASFWLTFAIKTHGFGAKSRNLSGMRTGSAVMLFRTMQPQGSSNRAARQQQKQQ